MTVNKAGALETRCQVLQHCRKHAVVLRHKLVFVFNTFSFVFVLARNRRHATNRADLGHDDLPCSQVIQPLQIHGQNVHAMQTAAYYKISFYRYYLVNRPIRI